MRALRDQKGHIYCLCSPPPPPPPPPTHTKEILIFSVYILSSQASLRICTVSPGPLLFSNNTGTDPLKNHKVNKPALNVGPLLVQQQNAI